MGINSMVITIDNFDNAAVADDIEGEVVLILKNLIKNIEVHGVLYFESRRLMDSNGNRVGWVAIDFSDDTEDDEETSSGNSAWQGDDNDNS